MNPLSIERRQATGPRPGPTAGMRRADPALQPDDAADAPADPADPADAGAADGSGGTQTATYLSSESLTFPGVTGVASIVVLLWAKLSGDGSTPDSVIVVVAAVFGAGLILLGLVDPKRDDKTVYGTVTQVLVGLLNTVLLLAALLGIASVT